MSRGIYIVANNRVADNAIALLNSIRAYDPDVNIFLIPFDENYQNIANTIAKLHNVKLFPNLALLENFTQKIADIFDRDFLALPNKMRKLVAWFGPLDKFLYIDTDIIVFEKISEVLERLEAADFLCCDYHHLGRGLKDIFSPLVTEQNIFTTEQLADVFNSGFWASKKGTISKNRMYELLADCARHREYFDFSRQTTDQPILNYIVLQSMPKRLNLVKLADNVPGSWAGSKHFEEKDRILYDRGQRLMYLHWAGTPMKPGGPYRELWEHYRYLHDPHPPQQQSPVNPEKDLWQQIKKTIKEKMKGK